MGCWLLFFVVGCLNVSINRIVVVVVVIAVVIVMVVVNVIVDVIVVIAIACVDEYDGKDADARAIRDALVPLLPIAYAMKKNKK